MRILVTYFEPFDNRKENISEQIVTKLSEELEVAIIKIPVSYQRAFQVIKDKIKDYDYVVLTGEAVSRSELTVEYLAVNLAHSKTSDNDNIIYQNEKIGSDDAYISNTNVIKLVEETKTKISMSAGTFVCNYLYYQTLKYIKTNNLQTKSVFIHFPGINLEKAEESFVRIIKYLQ